MIRFGNSPCALADKKGDAAIPIEPFVKGLKDKNPRVRVMAAWGLNRLSRPEAIDPLMPLLADSGSDRCPCGDAEPGRASCSRCMHECGLAV